MKKHHSQPSRALNRREFLESTAATAALVFTAPLFGQGSKPNSIIGGVQIGVITYSFRSMPDQSAGAMLRYCLDAGINAIELMGEPAEGYAGLPPDPNAERYRRLVQRNFMQNPPPLSAAEEREKTEVVAARAAYLREVAAWRARASMDRFAELKRLYNDAGVTIYGFKPSTFDRTHTDAEIDYGMRAAKALGATHVTVELPEDVAQTARLGAAALKHGLKVGYHQHLQATPTLWDAALAASPANGINLDLGHYTAAGDFDGVAFIGRHHERITSMHLKDRQTKTNGQANLPWGSGNTPITAALRLMRDKQYRFPATIELEYPVPEGSDAVAEVRKCVDYCRRALSRNP